MTERMTDKDLETLQMICDASEGDAVPAGATENERSLHETLLMAIGAIRSLIAEVRRLRSEQHITREAQ